MHRSGTSALTRMLGSLGCRLPKTLLEPNEYNALGYWESSEISELNDAILKSAGSSWDDWEAFHQGWYASLVADEFRDHARTVLENEFGDSRLFVLKDPRVCRLLEFWIDALKDIAAAPVIAVTIRNPLEVAASLHHRDMIDPSIGLLLWLRHVLDAEATSRDSRRVFVRYEDLLGNWAETAIRLGRELGVIWPKDSSSSEMDIESYLTPSQRHHARDDDAIFHSPSVSRWVKESFKIVDRWTRGDVRESDGPELDSIRSAFDEAGAVFVRPIVGGMRAAQNNKVLQTEIVNLNDAIVGREKHIGDLNQAVADRDSDVSSLNRVLAAKDSQIESLNQAIADRDVRLDAINHAIADRDGQISTLNRAVAERDGQVNALNLAVADRDSDIADRDGQLEALNLAVADRDSDIADRDGQLEALNLAVADRDSGIADRDGQLEALNLAVADRDSGIADRDGQLEALNLAVADRDSGIADRDGQLEALNLAVADRDSGIADRDGQLEALNLAVADRDSGIADRDGQLEALNLAVADRDSGIADRDGQLEALNLAVADRDSGIADRDGQLEALNLAVADRDSGIADRDGQLEALNLAVADRDSGIADRDGQLEALNLAVADRAVADRDSGIADRDRQIEDFRASTSWRITKPLRVLKPILVGAVRAPHRLLGRAAVGTLRVAWLLVPFGWSPKQRIKMSLLRTRFFRRFDRAPEQIPIRTYTSSGRVDLANGNYEAHKNQGHIPILFDPTYYLACNEDIREADIDPLVHYLEYGAVEGRLPIDIEPDEIDPMIRDLHRLDMNANEAFAFDTTFYRALYPDLTSLPDDKLADHYRRHGQGESRSSSMAEFALQICDTPREIPLDFNPAEYIDLYLDLKSFAEKSPLEALRHYMCHGRWEPRLHTLRGDGATNAADTPSADLELPAELTSSTRPLCVLAHVYYPELWDELSEYLSNLPEETCDLYVNLVDTSFSQGLIMRIRETFPSARIYISENVGRDIGGFCQLLRNLRMEDYRLFCLVHTKKSPHMGKGEVQLWRRKLLTPLMGTRERAVENIKLMLMHDEIGLIGSLQCRYTELNDNPEKYFELLSRLGVSEEASDVEFLSGTMMFVRREVLQRVAEVASDIPFENGEDKSLAFHRDGQWAHAVERAFGAVVRNMNYQFEWR